MADDRPGWARRMCAERAARGWSQARAVDAMRAHAGDDKLTGTASLLRNWKRWESGEVEPDNFYKPLIAATFGTVTAAFFPREKPDLDSHLLSGTGMDTLELVSRLRVSDVSPATIEAMHIAVERLNCEYSHTAPDSLLVEGRAWLQRLNSLRDGRLTLSQHREVLSLAGEVARLVGCVEYDMGLRDTAEATRRAALTLGEESGNADVVGWAHEMRSWYALTQGQYRAAIVAAQAGLKAVGTTHSVAVQLSAHQAKAWARIGDRRQVEVALDTGRGVLEALPYPENLDNHFVIDPQKWDFYTMDCYRLVEEDNLAETYALEVIRSSVDPDGTVRKPMRVAEAHVTLGVVAARRGALEAALAAGRAALSEGRRSLPSLAMHTSELATVLREHFPGEPAVGEYLDELRALTSP
ncbi:MAG TPA: XRE family transcriptional regulator [Micromonosporaceae bacterium]|nr:XRE family transcriptional regulator [Micromonosporaceae bacterium]